MKENDGEDGKVREREEVTGMTRMTAWKKKRVRMSVRERVRERERKKERRGRREERDREKESNTLTQENIDKSMLGNCECFAIMNVNVYKY